VAPYFDTLRKRTSMLLDEAAFHIARFLDEIQFRIALAFDVLLGRMPRPVESRTWLRSVEVPTLIECHDWVNDKRLFSVLVWPPLQVPTEQADRVFNERVEAVKAIICKGASEAAWSIRLTVDHSLVWDHGRECWKDSTGFYYDGRRPKQLAAQGSSGG